MKNASETVKNQSDVAYRLRTILRKLSRFVPGPNDSGILDRLPELVCPQMAHEGVGEGQMPGQYPRRELCPTGRVVAVLIHEAKLAITRYWELVRTDETVGLTELIERLEGYVKDGLGKYELAGDEPRGYHLVRKIQPGEPKKAARAVNAAPAPKKTK